MKKEYIEIDNKFYQECDIIMLSTNTDSVIKKQISAGILDYSPAMMRMKEKDWENQHLYFISDKEIKAGNWYYDVKLNRIYQSASGHNNEFYKEKPRYLKVIATTDKLLLTCNGVKREGESCSYNNNCKFPKCQLPRPSNEFLSKFCELGGIDKVLVLIKDTGYYEDNKHIKTEYSLFVAPDNTITCKPVKEDTLSKLLIKAKSFHDGPWISVKNIVEWYKENYPK